MGKNCIRIAFKLVISNEINWVESSFAGVEGELKVSLEFMDN